MLGSLVAGVSSLAAGKALADATPVDLFDDRNVRKKGFELIYEARDLDLDQATRDGLSQFRGDLAATRDRYKEASRRIEKDLGGFIQKEYWCAAALQLARCQCLRIAAQQPALFVRTTQSNLTCCGARQCSEPCSTLLSTVQYALHVRRPCCDAAPSHSAGVRGLRAGEAECGQQSVMRVRRSEAIEELRRQVGNFRFDLKNLAASKGDKKERKEGLAKAKDLVTACEQLDLAMRKKDQEKAKQLYTLVIDKLNDFSSFVA